MAPNESNAAQQAGLKSHYTPEDEIRRIEIASPNGLAPEPYRTEFRRDYARLVHSPAFRRLCGKTQLFPAGESDYFRNRLTHSLEVAQIAKSIAHQLSHRDGSDLQGVLIDLDLIETAALAHDIGHPPFGHNGEEVLDECMRDSGGFEGNAQSLRVLTRLEKRQSEYEIGGTPFAFNQDTLEDCRAGLNLTYRTIASVIKYDSAIPKTQQKRDGKSIHKGYYTIDQEIVDAVRGKISPKGGVTLRTLECSIMDISDDIAYSTYDLEDALKSGKLRPMDMLGAPEEVLVSVAGKVSSRYTRAYGKDIDFSIEDVLKTLREIFRFYFDIYSEGVREDFDGNPLGHPLRTVPSAFRALGENGYVRSQLTSKLVGEHIRAIRVHQPDGLEDYPLWWNVRLEEERYLQMEVLKNFVFEVIIQSPEFQVYKHKGQKIVSDIFYALNEKEWSYQLLPNDFKKMFEILSDEKENRTRLISDFIAGMTDSYAAEFHRRLYSDDKTSVMPPL